MQASSKQPPSIKLDTDGPRSGAAVGTTCTAAGASLPSAVSASSDRRSSLASASSHASANATPSSVNRGKLAGFGGTLEPETAGLPSEAQLPTSAFVDEPVSELVKPGSRILFRDLAPRAFALLRSKVQDRGQTRDRA